MHHCKKTVVLLNVALLIMCLPWTMSSAAEIIIKPMIKESWKIDSNFTKTEIGEREVDTFLIQPGIDIRYTTAKSLIGLNYNLGIYRYDDNDPIPAGALAADEENYVEHLVNLTARTRPTDRLTLGLTESYTRTRDPAASDIVHNSISRDKFYINRLNPSLLYAFGEKFTAGLQYRNTKTDYDPEAREDSTIDRGIFNLVYNFSRTASMDLEYQYWETDYDLTTSGYTSHNPRLIFRKQFKIYTFEVAGGYHDRAFDDPALEDLDLFTYRFGITGQNPPAPEVPRSYIRLFIEQNFNDVGANDAYFKTNQVRLGAGHIFMGKLPSSITARYQKSDYERTTGTTPQGTIELREDDLYAFSGSLGYMITDWAIFSVSAGYEDRDSNIDGNDYENRYIMALLDLSYSFPRRR